MELAFAAFLLIVIIVGSIALAIGVPLAFGVMLYDVVQDRKQRVAEAKAPAREDAHIGIAVKRGIARSYVILGSAFWSAATFAELYSGGQSEAGTALMAALIPLGACLITLVIGWYWERFTSGVLMLAALGVLAWGVVYQFDMQTWLIITVMLLGPMVTASVLFWLARRDQDAYELAFSLPPQVAFAFAARSQLDA
ncbi:MAG: DUF7670 domain-containing protein [Coriobacteriia bacterium]